MFFNQEIVNQIEENYESIKSLKEKLEMITKKIQLL